MFLAILYETFKYSLTASEFSYVAECKCGSAADKSRPILLYEMICYIENTQNFVFLNELDKVRHKKIKVLQNPATDICSYVDFYFL